MAKYRIHYDQTFDIEADSQEDALRLLDESGVWSESTDPRVRKIWDNTEVENNGRDNG